MACHRYYISSKEVVLPARNDAEIGATNSLHDRCNTAGITKDLIDKAVKLPPTTMQHVWWPCLW